MLSLVGFEPTVFLIIGLPLVYRLRYEARQEEVQRNKINLERVKTQARVVEGTAKQDQLQ